MTFRLFVLIAALVTTLSCARKTDMTQPHILLAENFARALGEGRFEDAHGLLTDDQKKLLPAAALQKEYVEMVSSGPGPVKHVEVMQTLGFWPEKKKDDVGWVYVAIAGDSFSEAVTVIVTRVGTERLAIRSVEWGRP